MLNQVVGDRNKWIKTTKLPYAAVFLTCKVYTATVTVWWGMYLLMNC